MASPLVLPTVLVFFVLFVFGVLVGSFLNVVILRYNTGMPIARGRSACFACNRQLSWYELLPLASFAVQGGKCRGCSSRISWQYPLVELATGLCFVAAYLVARSPMEFLLLAALLCFYVAIFVYDLRHKIIPDLFSYGAALIALALLALDWRSSGSLGYLSLLSGPCLFLFFWFFWFVSRGRWMGLGDGKLALSVGWALGMSAGVSALLLSFWIGAAFTLALMAYQRIFHRSKALGMKSQVPFGPFMLVAFLAVLLFHLDIPTLLAHLAV